MANPTTFSVVLTRLYSILKALKSQKLISILVTGMGALSAITYDYDLDVLIVGAGFSGIYQLHKYRLLNLRAKIFEAGSNLGGVWFWHNFPGARVDIPVPMYEFSSEDLWKEWYWSERYPSQKELRSYFEHVEKKLDVKKDRTPNLAIPMRQEKLDRASNCCWP
ncbi:cyclohexanone monooxygenase [Lentinula edodes]|uniref:Cyclohexanone monooxygenase n=1 Tax=Lentinula edodes TaxID=5353 RepID=A0A1Q3EPW8_LENED|nr:cyclohexanone monooxygenase [Lentinula edodes]